MTPAPAGKPAHRFTAIEGLRAWLACTVVLYHIAWITDLPGFYGFESIANRAAAVAVDIFMMISGFVIAELLLRRNESWPAYITRRAFRLFPAYWIALALGAIAMSVQMDVLRELSWFNSPTFTGYVADKAELADAMARQPLTQSLLHVGLLQGLAPPFLVPNATHAILIPAWSLSLEWQFYLVAPFLVLLLRREKTAAITIVLVGAVLLALTKGWIPSSWNSGALLIDGLHLFVIGILTRFGLSHLRQAGTGGWVVAIGIACVGTLLMKNPAISFWLAFVVVLGRRAGANATHAYLERAFHAAFESRIATSVGSWSYSIYILHAPVIVLACFFLMPLFPSSRIEAAIAVTLVAVPVTLAGSWLMHRYVERPMIALGARIAARLEQRHTASAKPTLELQRVVAP